MTEVRKAREAFFLSAIFACRAIDSNNDRSAVYDLLLTANGGVSDCRAAAGLGRNWVNDKQ